MARDSARRVLDETERRAHPEPQDGGGRRLSGSRSASPGVREQPGATSRRSAKSAARRSESWAKRRRRAMWSATVWVAPGAREYPPELSDSLPAEASAQAGPLNDPLWVNNARPRSTWTP
jgi:hypothetical protein